MAKSKSLVGKTITIPAGTRVSRLGETNKRSAPSTVTVKRVATTKGGNTKVFWKSHGYAASAVL